MCCLSSLFRSRVLSFKLSSIASNSYTELASLRVCSDLERQSGASIREIMIDRVDRTVPKGKSKSDMKRTISSFDSRRSWLFRLHGIRCPQSPINLESKFLSLSLLASSLPANARNAYRASQNR